MCMRTPLKKKKGKQSGALARATSSLRVLRGAIFLTGLRQLVKKNAFVFPKPGSLTHISEEGLSAYGILAGWVRFPRGTRAGRLAPRDPGEEMEDALGGVLCSVIPIRHNKNQRQPRPGRPRIHLQPSAVHTQPQTLYSRRKNTAVHTHLRLYETAGRHWKTSCGDLLKSDWISDVREHHVFFFFLFFFP